MARPASAHQELVCEALALGSFATRQPHVNVHPYRLSSAGSGAAATSLLFCIGSGGGDTNLPNNKTLAQQAALYVSNPWCGLRVWRGLLCVSS